MKWLTFPLLGFMLVAMAARCRGAELRVEAIGHTTRVIYHSPETPGYTSWVGLWQLPDGRLRYDFLQLTGPRAKPRATVPVFESRDGGDTWTHVTDTPSEAAFSPEGYLAVSKDSGRGMAVLPNGTLVRPVWPLEENEKTSGYVERSTDGGKTWGEKIFFLPAKDYRTWPTLIRVLGDGRLVLMAGCWKRGDCQNGAGPLPNMTKTMFVSSDEGRTWGAPIVVMPTKQGVCEESDFCELPNGDLFFVHRTEHVHSVRMQSFVRKQGQAFVPGPCEPAALVHSGFPAVLRTREGIILHLATTGVHWTADLGKTWTQLKIPGTPYYPKALQRPDGMILVLGHEGSDDRYGTVDQCIKQQTFRLRVGGAR
jgi:hypothetical protein